LLKLKKFENFLFFFWGDQVVEVEEV